MESNIKLRIEGRTAVRVSVTLDKIVFERLEKYKKKNNIKSLSPMISAMLEDWLDEKEKS